MTKELLADFQGLKFLKYTIGSLVFFLLNLLRKYLEDLLFVTFSHSTHKILKRLLKLDSHQCDNFHRSGFFRPIAFIPLKGTSQNITAIIFKNCRSILVRSWRYLHGAIYQSDNYQKVFIFIALKYHSGTLVQRNTDHGL